MRIASRYAKSARLTVARLNVLRPEHPTPLELRRRID
jgi:hypothetical protein